MRLAIVSVGYMKDLAISAGVKRLSSEIIELYNIKTTPIFLETDCIMLLSSSVRDCSISV